ncbi:type IV secretion system DNA-binding domain-containing protein, partial [Candidatus Parcubacteria bacterium]|nr:type IV secretion system DNA-binding domain-containing protein [Candidatus Parcubacteria bacterium]
MSDINFLGRTNFRNEEKRFGIRVDDRRRHLYVIGKTGMGKTQLLLNMAVQDIRAGRGLGFVDPHGEAAEALLDFVPKERIKDVIYFNPADRDFPISFNVMENVAIEQRHLVASGLMGVFKKIWPDVWSARMEYILNNALLALLEHPSTTLLGINRMLVDIDYRQRVVEGLKDPVVRAFWEQEFSRYSQRYEVEATAAIQNKIGQFISSPLIRNIIGQKDS